MSLFNVETGMTTISLNHFVWSPPITQAGQQQICIRKKEKLEIFSTVFKCVIVLRQGMLNYNYSFTIIHNTFTVALSHVHMICGRHFFVRASDEHCVVIIIYQ